MKEKTNSSGEAKIRDRWSKRKSNKKVTGIPIIRRETKSINKKKMFRLLSQRKVLVLIWINNLRRWAVKNRMMKARKTSKKVNKLIKIVKKTKMDLSNKRWRNKAMNK